MFLAAGLFTTLFLVGLVLGEDSDLGGILMIFGIAAVVSVPASLILGYLFVGVSLFFYKLLLRIGFIENEDGEQIVIVEQRPDPTLNA